MPSDTYTWSIVIAFSQIRIYGWIATHSAFIADKMKDFYYELYFSKIKVFNEIDCMLVLVWDNSAIHKSGKIKDS